MAIKKTKGQVRKHAYSTKPVSAPITTGCHVYERGTSPKRRGLISVLGEQVSEVTFIATGHKQFISNKFIINLGKPEA